MTSRRASRRKGHRPRPQRHAHRRHHEELDGDVLVQPAWCDGTPAAIEEAKQSTHDRVIEALGARRTGAVRWIISQTIDASYDLCTELLDGEHDPAWSGYIRQIRAHLREYGGLVLVAYAPGRRDGPETFVPPPGT